MSFVRNKSQLIAFRVGDRVSFETDHGTVEGIVMRVNQKTVTIDSDDGRSWRVSPGFVSKIVNSTSTPKKSGNLFSVPNKKSEQR